MKKITNIVLDGSKMKTSVNTRSLKVFGDIGSVFSLQIKNNAGNFYDFNTRAFSSTYTSVSTLNVELKSNYYNTSINFPASSGGDIYTVKILAQPHFNTEIGENSVYRKTKYFWQKTINQSAADPTVTFTWEYSAKMDVIALWFSSIGNAGQISGASTRSLTALTADKLDISTTLSTHGDATDAGVALSNESYSGSNTQTFGDEVLFWQTATTFYETTSASTHDAGAASTMLILNTTEGLVVGMKIHSIESNGGYESGSTEIVSIDSTTQVTLSEGKQWATAKDIVFNAYGASLIKEASGVGIVPGDIGEASLVQLTKQVRTATTTSGETIDVRGTGGIGKGATVRTEGLNMASSASACTVSSISQSVDNGAITIVNGEFGPLRVGQIMYFDGFSNQVKINNAKINIIKYPTSNQVIYFDLTKILTAGRNS